ncbi:NADPH-dependent 2,4-dienoyl-CoA reductase [Brachybacterium muris]|uniref:NADPH-dependent 2,4-dienoyl-CoA reductase n=1 Tax=Brachybacterium muris TaxID=219301 RepID=UPI0021A2EAB1|nr:NADPH-dependent 2,4-dienoyl-CoA reductase [Brachybacterium muris]MCT1431428.1 NADPH-dependent 2,4-dienoyl-CoA reductase [Brachybacterium muris]
MRTPRPGYARLLSPLDLGRFEVRNRIVMGSMHVGLEDSPADADKLAAYLAERARGGVGLIVTGGYSPDRTGRLTPRGGQADERTMERHRVITREVHEADGRIILQLLHAGRYAFHPLAASARAGKSPLTPFRARRLTRRGVQRTIDHFAAAAHRAVQAGYDGVELMGSEGYLLNQFLAPATNRRQDRWGRGAEARRAFPLAVAAAVREAIGPDALLSYRISLLDLVPEGQDWVETMVLARGLTERGVDVLSTGIGWHESRVPTIVTSVPRAAFTPLTERLRMSVDVPVVASNRIHDPAVAEQVLADGQADLISMARPLLADPHLPRKLADGRASQVVPCIACNQACLDKVFDGQRASCLVNPRAARETELVLTPVLERRRRRVAVVGAGPAGIEAALAAAERGHVVTLFEASAELGGQLRMAARIPGKEDYGQLLHSWPMRLAAAGVGIRLNTRPTAEDLLGFHDVIVATGVAPRAVDLPGFAPDGNGPAADTPDTPDATDATDASKSAAAGPQVISYADLLEGRAEAGQRVAIIGAGGIGVDVAQFLTAPQPSPTLDADTWREHWGVVDPAERRGGILPRPRPQPRVTPDSETSDGTGTDVSADARPTDGRRSREVHLLQRKETKIGAGLGRTTGWVHRAELRRAGVVQHTGVAYQRIDEQGLHITVGEEQTLIEVDTVVICAGQVSERTLADELLAARSGRTPRVHVVGGADVAAELDAERAIRQAVETSAGL